MKLIDMDELAAFIREVNGDNRMGAGVLAENICDWIASKQPPTSEFLCEDGELQNLLNFSVDMALGRCGQDEAMYWKELLDSVTARLGNQTHAAGLADALEWYAEKVKECRKIGSDGDNARQALDLDGGFRALDALADRHVQVDSWAPSDHEYDRSIHSNPDAKAWADMFVSTFPGLADKHGLMLGWFANAMMAMHDHLMRKAEQPQLPDGMNKASEVQLPMTVNYEGREWSLYTFDFATPDGTFSSYLYAVSFEHAAALLADLKETAVLKGRMVEVRP